MGHASSTLDRPRIHGNLGPKKIGTTGVGTNGGALSPASAAATAASTEDSVIDASTSRAAVRAAWDWCCLPPPARGGYSPAPATALTPTAP
eukprot:CAMPEP_0171875658 /NCGR_PEP_ID=MMETSP0992-20121227/35673_1 /TAXON_ID=483369 /ORGANISM="non described non described, Strain CCMP2098" /LENGTH=90 /DNA_ID=CAMNT_0012500641 /DNA_START=9 /DNA_END=277 /DNA_ORIENTATION=+